MKKYVARQLKYSLYTYSVGTLGGAISVEVEGGLFGWDSHDGSINEAKLYDPCIVTPQTRGVMQPYPR